MIKVIFALFMASFLYANPTSYNMVEDKSNSYFKAISDVVFFGSDEILGVNKNQKGYILLNNNKIEKGEIVISSNSFNTQNSRRDKHIKELINSKENSEIGFLITNHYQENGKDFLDGKLTINGIEKNQTILVKIENIENELIVSGKLTILYKDFDIKLPKVGGFIKKAKEDIEIGGKFVFIEKSK